MATEKQIAALPKWAQDIISQQSKAIIDQRALVDRAGWLRSAPAIDCGEWSLQANDPEALGVSFIYLPLRKFDRMVGPPGALLLRGESIEFYATDSAAIYPGATNCITIASTRRSQR